MNRGITEKGKMVKTMSIQEIVFGGRSSNPWLDLVTVQYMGGDCGSRCIDDKHGNNRFIGDECGNRCYAGNVCSYGRGCNSTDAGNWCTKV